MFEKKKRNKYTNNIFSNEKNKTNTPKYAADVKCIDDRCQKISFGERFTLSRILNHVKLPIYLPRYKSTVYGRFDLCSTCYTFNIICHLQNWSLSV